METMKLRPPHSFGNPAFDPLIPMMLHPPSFDRRRGLGEKRVLTRWRVQNWRVQNLKLAGKLVVSIFTTIEKRRSANLEM